MSEFSPKPSGSHEVIITKEYDDGTPPLVIRSYLPEDFSFDLVANYSEPFGDVTSDLASSGVKAGLSATTGRSLVFSALTAQVWTGNEAPEFSLGIWFETETDPRIDVRDQVFKLLTLIAPSNDTAAGGNLKGPGTVFRLPSNVVIREKEAKEKGATKEQMKDSQQPQNQQENTPVITDKRVWENSISNGTVSIQLGRYLFFPRVVITGVSPKFASSMDFARKIPQNAEVELRFKCLFAPTIEDWQNMLLKGEEQKGITNQGLKPDGLISGIKSKITGAVNEVGNKIQSGIQDITGKADKWTKDNLWK